MPLNIECKKNGEMVAFLFIMDIFGTFQHGVSSAGQ